MSALTDLSTRESHSGQTPESIARRVWGHHATLRYEHSPALEAPLRVAMVVEPVGGEGREYRVLATVAVES